MRFIAESDEYAVSDEPLELPAKLTRYGLSELVNHLLQQAPPVPFDFLADGELLRTSLRKFMQLRALSGVRAARPARSARRGPDGRRLRRGRAAPWLRCPGPRRLRAPARPPPAGSDARASLLPAREGARARLAGRAARLGLCALQPAVGRVRGAARSARRARARPAPRAARAPGPRRRARAHRLLSLLRTG